jgi:hypothetical protein
MGRGEAHINGFGESACVEIDIGRHVCPDIGSQCVAGVDVQCDLRPTLAGQQGIHPGYAGKWIPTGLQGAALMSSLVGRITAMSAHN